MKYPEYKNKKILIAGLGLYEQGSGISAARFFVGQGADVTVTDLKTRAELEKSIKELKGLKIKYVLGKHRVSDFKNADIVVKNPGMRRNSPYLKAAKAAKVQIESDITIFFKHCPAKIIGITGTRGKSTTASLAAAILSKKNKTYLGGNIKVSPLNFLNRVKPGDFVVVELSSWMLEDLNQKKMSPHIGVITNVMRDHLNTYSGMKAYQEAKAMIFKHQANDDFIILNRDNIITRGFGKRVPSQRFWFSLKDFKDENGSMVKAGQLIFRHDGKTWNVGKVSDVKMAGEHNLANALVAITVAKIQRVACAKVRSVLRSFEGIDNRQQLIKTKRGVKYYNDTTATTPDAGIVALKTLGDKKNVVLIAGGADKKLLYAEWAGQVKRSCKNIILLKGTATPKMIKELKKNRVGVDLVAKSMAEAVKSANKLVEKGDVVLLSPAAASFGLFKNEFDRGEQFVALVKRI